MKPIKFFSLIILMAALLWPTAAFAKDNFEDKVVFGGTFTLDSGDHHAGSLVIFGGAVTVEPDSIVNGDVVLIGGTVVVGGTVNGSVVGIGGAVRLNEDAVINGDVFTMGATLRREDGAKVQGQVVNGSDVPFSFTIPDDLSESELNIPSIPQAPSITVSANPILNIMWFFFRTFMYSALAVLLVMFFSNHVQRITNAALTQPLITAGAGLLTAFLAPLALVAITVTIILIPVTLVAVLLLFVAWLSGLVALGFEVGRRIAEAIKIEWAPAISAGVGTFILLFVLGGFNEIIPCIGWLPHLLVGIWGLGAVLMTRFGTQDYSINPPAASPDVPGLKEGEIHGEVVDMEVDVPAPSVEPTFEDEQLNEGNLSSEAESSEPSE